MLWCGIAHYCSEGNSNLLLLLGVSLSKTLLKRLPNQQSNLMNSSALKYSRLKNLKYDIQYLQFFNELKSNSIENEEKNNFILLGKAIKSVLSLGNCWNSASS